MNEQIYSWLLALCPADLRREFGAEMTEIFLEDLEDRRGRFGFRGAVRVWWRSLTDLRGVVLREAIAEGKFAVPLIAYGLHASYSCLIFLTHQELSPLREILTVILGPPGFTAIVAFLAAQVTNSGTLISLELERR